jgi:hypothetical protein
MKPCHFRTFYLILSGLTLIAVLASPLSFARNTPTGSRFNKVMTVIFENTDYSEALEQPYFAKFAKGGALLTNMYAETHPSQPNYIALTSGSTHKVVDDKNVKLNVRSIADLLEEHGKSWKVYAEAYPGNCFLGSSKGTYVRKHVPFLSYTNIQKNPARCKRIVDAAELQIDIQNGTLPDYSLYIPDMNNNGHDTNPAFASRWFQKTFSPLTQDARFMNGMLLIATFDEAAYLVENTSWPQTGSIFSNQIYTVLFGASVQAGVQNNQRLDHYHLLRLVEDELGLGNLGQNDQRAVPITGIWN